MMLSEYITSLQQQGFCCFTTQQALDALEVSSKALHMSLLRMRRKQSLVTIYKDFHLIVPPEYRVLGCLPPEHFIHFFMEHVNSPYYVCLLSAAMYHGAAHQKPQVFQVMTSKRIHSIIRGRIQINFIYKKDISKITPNKIKVPTGYINISTPGVTAMDLLMYPHQSGGINNIATVLTELIETIKAQELLTIARDSATKSWVQRLGYILEKIEPSERGNLNECTEILKNYIREINPSYIALSGRHVAGYPRNKEWKIIENITVESDI